MNTYACEAFILLGLGIFLLGCVVVIIIDSER
jgi:hypothetical protein